MAVNPFPETKLQIFSVGEMVWWNVASKNTYQGALTKEPLFLDCEQV